MKNEEGQIARNDVSAIMRDVFNVDPKKQQAKHCYLIIPKQMKK